MSWQYTDINLAPRAGRADELRAEAERENRFRTVMRAKRIARINSLRTWLSTTLDAIADRITPTEYQPDRFPRLDSEHYR